MTWTRTLTAVLLATAGAPAMADPSGGEGSAVRARIEREGIAVDMRIEPVTARRAVAADPLLSEADDVRFQFLISDTTTGRPLSGLYPAAWMQPFDGPPPSPSDCVEMVEELIGGNLFNRAELDLNVYYVLAMNHDATITVVDPLFGYGGTKLLALVSLLSPGEDWVRSRDQRRVFVSQPEAGRVGVVDTATWTLSDQLDVGPEPAKLALQGDGTFLWVATRSGVSVLDTRTLEVEARITTGDGPHRFAFSAEDRYAFVTNRGDGTTSVVDVHGLAVIRQLATGSRPTAIAYSPTAHRAYVTDAADGTVTVVDAEAVVGRMEAEPGVSAIRFAPGGRYAVALNPSTDSVYVIDAAVGRIIQRGKVNKEPEQVTFSDELAYVRHRGSEIVLMIPLDEIGTEGKPIPVVDFPGGQSPGGAPAALADAIVQAPGAQAVLVATPADKMIYYYKEGMAAPMGGFRNYDRQPRAVAVIDRSLRERRTPGTYETTAKLRRPGRYQVAFFLDTPRIVHCFETEVAPNPELERERLARRPPRVEAPFERRAVEAGRRHTFTYRLFDASSGEPLSGLGDVVVLFYTSGNWSERRPAREVSGGAYEVDFLPPAPGTYFVAVQALSRRLSFEASSPAVLVVVAP